MREELERLVEKWRSTALPNANYYSQALDACADELTAILAAHPQTEEQAARERLRVVNAVSALIELCEEAARDMPMHRRIEFRNRVTKALDAAERPDR